MESFMWLSQVIAIIGIASLFIPSWHGHNAPKDKPKHP